VPMAETGWRGHHGGPNGSPELGGQHGTAPCGGQISTLPKSSVGCPCRSLLDLCYVFLSSVDELVTDRGICWGAGRCAAAGNRWRRPGLAGWGRRGLVDCPILLGWLRLDVGLRTVGSVMDAYD
jgi:hypothetical protein